MSVFSEQIIIIQPINKFLVTEPKVHNHHHKSLLLDPYQVHITSTDIFTTNYSKAHFHVILPRVPTFPKIFFRQDFLTKLLIHFLFPPWICPLISPSLIYTVCSKSFETIFFIFFSGKSCNSVSLIVFKLSLLHWCTTPNAAANSGNSADMPFRDCA